MNRTKTLCKSLASAGLFIFHKGMMSMNLLQQSALAWKEITEYRYSLIYGYKKQLYPLHLTFSLSLPNYNSSKIVTRMYPFFTSIKADYILSSHYKLDNFIFIIKATAKDELKCDFVCCSIFEKDDQRNYETNQRSRTLLRKERIHIPSGTSNILFNKLFPQ